MILLLLLISYTYS